MTHKEGVITQKASLARPCSLPSRFPEVQLELAPVNLAYDRKNRCDLLTEIYLIQQLNLILF